VRDALAALRLHVRALYTFDARDRMTDVNEWCGGVAPRFHLARAPGGHVRAFRADVADACADALASLCDSEPVTHEPDGWPAHCEEYLRLLAPCDAVESGPAYALFREPVDAGIATAIDASNAHLLRGGLDTWLPDVAHRRPFVAVIEGGRAVAVCASVRITPAAHEAGVETVPDARDRGHGSAVVAAWAHAVRAQDALPLYSTSFDNVASQRLAIRLGFTRIGVDFHVT
jgi:hypothetical protein